ncbi:MAG TPA: HEAT repeat domain-containing protein [Planctomycetota bacterium]|nr:HEAT repeat domain-containing protein [Planctomycetota bacterium]
MTHRLLVLLLAAAPAFAHGGSFRGQGGGVPPGPGSHPTPSNPTNGGTHTWLTWWSYNQFQYTQFRKLQAERRGPVTNLDGRSEKDPNAWRARVRTELTPALIEALTDEDKEVRTAAAIALGKWRSVLAIPDLRRAYERDDDKEVRESAILGLALVRDPSLRPYLVTVASSQDTPERERGYALLGLGLLGDGESRAFLLSLLSPDDKEARALLPGAAKEPRLSAGKRAQFRCAAVAALTLAGEADLTREFVRIALDERLEEEVRAYAVTALGKTRATSALAMVMPLLRSECEALRRSAALALGRIASRADADVLDALAERVAGDRDRIVRHFATLSLGTIGGPRAFDLLKKHYDAGNKEARGFFLIAYGLCKEPGAGPILAEVAKTDPDPMMAAAACLALGLLEDAGHIPALRETFDRAKSWTLMQTSMLSLALMNDVASADKIENVLVGRRNPEVRTAAAIAFALLRQWSALPVLMGILREEKSIVTLTTISQVMGFLATEKAVEPLLALYRDKGLQRQARAFALVAVGALGDPEDVPLLVRLAFDLNYTIPSDPVDEAITIL